MGSAHARLRRKESERASGVTCQSTNQFKRYGGCKAVVYCSAKCALAHFWKSGHKRECSRAALPARPKDE